MSEALLAINSFGTLILLSFNTDPTVQLFWLCRKLILIYRNSGEWRWGGGGGGGRWLIEKKEFCTFSSCGEAVVPCSNRILWNSTPKFINFFFKLLIGLSCPLDGPC